MSLATRCPACGTIFRVVQDQLKVSEGWVRCGQCHEVFHGIEALFDLDSDPALAARRAARGATMPAPAPSPVAAFAATPPPSIRPPEAPAAPALPPPVAPARQPAPSPAPVTPAASPPRFEPAAPAPEPSGFAPATRVASTPIGTPMMRRTIAPRFAARLAEESARTRPATEPEAAPPPAIVVATPPVPVPAPAPMVTPAPFVVEPTWPAPAAAGAAGTGSWPSEATQAPAPTPDLLAEAPAAPPRPTAAHDLDLQPEADGSPGTAVDEAPPAPRRLAAAPPPPGRVVDGEDDEGDDGPLTLASMLPDASEWPRPAEPRQRRRARAPEASPPPAAAPAPAATSAEEQAVADARFLREARRDARWNKPWVRNALAASLVLLALGAAAQVAWPLRDTLAARYPATRPAWELLCAQAGCTIEAPRALASLALDGSSLTRTGTEHVLLFSADLHNRSDQEVRMPSFDLTFMDLNGEIVARKVLSPEQIGIAQKALAPEAELHVHARIQVGSLDASGFQAYLFYP